MPEMTKKEAIDYLNDGLIAAAHLPPYHFRHNEAYILTIKAPRDIPEQRCTTCDVSQLRQEVEQIRRDNHSLGREVARQNLELVAAEEALKARVDKLEKMHEKKLKQCNPRAWGETALMPMEG